MSSHVLFYQLPFFSFCYEERPKHFHGPKQACHIDEAELSLCESGVSQGYVGSCDTPIYGGQCSFIQPGIEHSSWTTDGPVVETNIHFQHSWLEKLADDMNLKTVPTWPQFNFKTPQLIDSTVSTIKSVLLEDKDPDEFTLSSLATSLGALMLRHLARNQNMFEATGSRSVWARLDEVEAKLRDQPHETVSLKQLAQDAGLSQYHFLRLFKKQYGLPPHAYLTKIRIEKAEQLIRNTELPLTNIAYDLGFTSSSRFAQLFKKQYGTTPSRWRVEARC